MNAPATGMEAELGAVRMGPSMWGVIYRCVDSPRYLRMIPSTVGLKAHEVADLESWQRWWPTSRFAPIIDTVQETRGGLWFHHVYYETEAQNTLAQKLDDADPDTRIAAVVATLRALPTWWQELGKGFLPMPDDIVFLDDEPQLLRPPQWGVPSIDELFAEPERIAHLAPELVRGAGGRSLDATADLFSVGVMAMRCFETPGHRDPRAMLHRMACGVGVGPRRGESRLRGWQDRVLGVRHAIAIVGNLVAVDPAVREVRGLAELAENHLTTCPPAMEPLTAVRALREAGYPEQAMDLARAAMLDAPSYELFLLAADTALRELRDPLECLSLVDKAIQIDDQRADAYVAQFEMISELRTQMMVVLSSAIDDSFANRLDMTMDNAYRHLPGVEQAKRAHDMARYLIDRGRIPAANRFLHDALHEDGTELWWRFDLMLDYAETFLRVGRLDTARQVADQIRHGLRRVRQNQTMSEAKVRNHGDRLAVFDLWLHRRQHGEEK